MPVIARETRIEHDYEHEHEKKCPAHRLRQSRSRQGLSRTARMRSVAFRNNLATMQEIFRLHDEGALFAPPDWYYRSTKPVEELYDTIADPYELDNLAGRTEYRDVLERMRGAHEDWVDATGDLGATLEAELADRFWPGGTQPRTPAPQLMPPGGSFATPTQVTLTTSEPGASIAYTFDDGPAPARWLLYTGPIAIDASTTLHARAVRYGWAESDEIRASFTIATPQ